MEIVVVEVAWKALSPVVTGVVWAGIDPLACDRRVVPVARAAWLQRALRTASP